MKRIDLLKQKDNLWREIEELKKQNLGERYSAKSVAINERIKMLKKKYEFTRLLLKANKQ